LSIALNTFQALAALFAIGFLGFWIVRKEVLPGKALRFLYPLAIEIALPSLIFVNIVRNLRPAEQPDWWLWPPRFLGFMLWAGVLTALCSLFARRAFRREFAVALLFQNITFLPLVILTQLFGDGSPHLLSLFLFGILFAPLFFNTYYLFFAREWRGLQWRKTLHPVVIASCLGVLLCTLGIQDLVPGFVLSSLDLLGGMCVPLLILILGGNLSADLRMRGKTQLRETFAFVAAKNIVFPLATLAVLLLLKPPGDIALILFLQSAVPPIASIPILVEREGGDGGGVSRFVVASSALSLISIPLLMLLFSRFFPVG